jgi:hypothetical protein
MGRDQGVPGINPGWIGNYPQAIGVIDGKIFGGVNSGMALTTEKGQANAPGEPAFFILDRRERGAGLPIGRGFTAGHGLEFHRKIGIKLTDSVNDGARLGQGEGTSPGGDSKDWVSFYHGRPEKAPSREEEDSGEGRGEGAASIRGEFSGTEELPGRG